MRPLPKFSDLVEAYPNKKVVPAKDLLDRIGGQVRSLVHDAGNTGPVRLSEALNGEGDPLRRVPGIAEWRGASYVARFRRVTADRYIVRVADMKTYMEHQYGPGKVIYDATKGSETLSLVGPTQGIVILVLKGYRAAFGANGHAGLFRVFPAGRSPPRLVGAGSGECFWYPVGVPMTGYFWEAHP